MESEGSPATDPDLVFMTRLMQLAVGARTMLRDKSYAFPAVSNDLLKTFFPILSTFILEVQLREPDEADGAQPRPPPPPPRRRSCSCQGVGQGSCGQPPGSAPSAAIVAAPLRASSSLTLSIRQARTNNKQQWSWQGVS